MKTFWPRTPREEELFQQMSEQSKAAWRIVWMDGFKFGVIFAIGAGGVIFGLISIFHHHP